MSDEEDVWQPTRGALTADQMALLGELQVYLDLSLQSLRDNQHVNAAIVRVEAATGVVTIEIQASLTRENTP